MRIMTSCNISVRLIFVFVTVNERTMLSLDDYDLVKFNYVTKFFNIIDSGLALRSSLSRSRQ